MKPVVVRDVAVGEGIPKICIPIMGRTKDEIIKEARDCLKLPGDMVEWRADFFEQIFDTQAVFNTAEELRAVLGNVPILFTFRTLREGGERAIEVGEYEKLTAAAAQSGFVDMIDIEAFTGDEVVCRIIEAVHASGAKALLSNHDFQGTPDKDEIVRRLCRMQEMGADIPKIAVMPQNERDVLTLMEATLDMTEQYAQRPFITIAMGKLGVISRLSGGIFGSAVTFGASRKVSAPGQIRAEELAELLKIIDTSIYSTSPGK